MENRKQLVPLAQQYKQHLPTIKLQSKQVKKNQQNGSFRVQICRGGKQTTFGPFETAIQAALAYDQAAIKAGRKKSRLNFPDGLPIIQESDIEDGASFSV